MQRIEELDEEQRSVLDSNHKKIQEKETLAHADGVHVTGPDTAEESGTKRSPMHDAIAKQSPRTSGSAPLESANEENKSENGTLSSQTPYTGSMHWPSWDRATPKQF